MSIGYAIRRYTSGKPRASRRYRRSGQSSRRVCPAGVSCNRGFNYQRALAVVRPELAAKLANPQGHDNAVSSGEYLPGLASYLDDADGTAATQRRPGPTPDQRRHSRRGLHS